MHPALTAPAQAPSIAGASTAHPLPSVDSMVQGEVNGPEVEPTASEPEPVLSLHFCARGNHGPCVGVAYDLSGGVAAMKSCQCACHQGKQPSRKRSQW